MDQAPYELDEVRRDVVLTAIRQVCAYKKWSLLAIHVRSTHVHVVLVAAGDPEPVMNAFKSYASRRLNETGVDIPGRKRWARHGSTCWLWNRENVHDAIHYVVHEQGAPMALYEAPEIE